MNIGLSDEDTELALSIPRINSGEASFGFSAYSDAYKISVPVRIGDQMLADVMPSVIKIDVEGYEPRVMKGLVDTIRRSHPLIITEVVGHHLIRCGSSVEALLDGMTELGYEGFRFSALRNGKDFHLTRITAVGQEDCDIAWLHSESEVYARLRTLVRAR